jgi:hypothetical protein
MKSSKWIAIGLVIVVCVTGTGCVSPFYGTARIEKGFHADAGVAGTTYVGMGIEDYAIHTGGRGDLFARYGFNEYLQVNGRIGFGLGKYLGSDTIINDIPFFLDGGIGIQGAFPIGWFTPALRAELSYPWSSIGLILGFGKREIVTLGSRLIYPGFLDAFVVLHPFQRWSFFAGIGPVPPFDYDSKLIGTLGIGYKIR